MFQRPFNYMRTRRAGGPTPPKHRTVRPPPPTEIILEPRINGIPKGSRMDQLRAALKGTVRVLWSETSFQSVATFYFDLQSPMTYGRFTHGSFKLWVKRGDEGCRVLPKSDMVWTGSDLDAARSSNYVLYVQADLSEDLQKILEGGPVGEARVELFDKSFRVLSAHEAEPLLGRVVPRAKPASIPAPVPEPVPAPVYVPLTDRTLLDEARVAYEPTVAEKERVLSSVLAAVHLDDRYAELSV